MNEKFRLLRVSCYLGAFIDLLATILLLFPKAGTVVFGLNLVPGPEYYVVSRIAAALMLGWTVLLLWASQEPLARQGVIAITVFPVLVGLLLASILAVTSGSIRVEKMAPMWVMCGVMIPLFLYSYLYRKYY